MAERSNVVDPITARLQVIEEAVRRNMPMADDWASWLIEGVKKVERDGSVDAEWLREFDQENSYI